MKTKIVISLFLLFFVLVYFLSQIITAKENKTESGSGTHPSKFHIGFIDMGRQRNFNFLAPLNFNLWHTLLPNAISGGKYVAKGWTDFGAPADTLFSPLAYYQSQVDTILSTNSRNNYTSFIARPKLEMLTFAQRSDYQCEYVTPLTLDTVEWWYAFDSSDFSSSCDTADSCVIVKHFTLGLNPGYIAKCLRANMEQVWLSSPNELYNDTNYSWYIKPRMRIDSPFANNPLNWDKKVCRIAVINYDGDTVRKVDIKVSNFLNEQYLYDGSYKEEFRFDGNIHPLLIDTGRILNPRQLYNTDSCNFDIQVFWYGECELWIDYVRVDNDWANDLFSTDPNNQNHIRDSLWIKWEADDIASLNTTYNFYTDESEYNFMPAIKYINEKIHQYKPTLSINSLINITFHTPLLNKNYYYNYSPHRPLPVTKIRENVSKWKMNEIMVEIYPLYSNGFSMDHWGKWQTLPNTLPITGYNVADGVLGIPASPSMYENNLDSIINMFYTSDLKTSWDVAVPLQIPLHLLLQIALTYGGAETNIGWREPTNQEINLMANLALTYNVKTISYFIYGSWGEMEDDQSSYTRGILGSGTGNVNQFDTIRRNPNAYGQNKWAALCSLNVHINKLGDYMVSFNESQSHTYNYRNQTERGLLNSNSYFNRFITLRPGPIGAQTDCNEDFTPVVSNGWLYDCQYNTFLQIATFENSEPNTKYFMVVNRRCSPYINDNSDDNIGGHRKVRAYMKSDYFPSSVSGTWKIINCENGIAVDSFPTHNPNYVNLDWFMPGEGKLFKIVPITETGGTLMDDEYFNSNVAIKKSIYNGGYNITFGTSANVSFADSAGIYMNGGVLTIGNSSQSYGTNLQFKGITGSNKWQGLILEDCDTVNVYGATFSNILTDQPALNLTNCYHFKIMNSLFNF